MGRFGSFRLCHLQKKIDSRSLLNRILYITFLLPINFERLLHGELCYAKCFAANFAKMTTAFPCLLCFKIYDTKKKLQSHERNKHKNNKIIPHRHILCQPSNETLSFYQDTVIIRLKSSLGFNRHAIGKKHIAIDAFPESVYLFLFENEDSFRYIPSQRKYQCTFEGAIGGERLKNIFKYDEIIFRENTSTSTRGYILFEDIDGQYKATFGWKQKEWKENNRLFLTGTLLINFITNSGEFVDE